MNHCGLYFLPTLFYYTSNKGIWNSIKYCWNYNYKNRFNQTLTDEPAKSAFGILNEHVWKSKIEERIKNSDELNNENDKIIENDSAEKINKNIYEHLNIHSFNPYMDFISKLFQEVTKKLSFKHEQELLQSFVKWKIRINDKKIDLQVFKKIDDELQ